MLPAQTPVATSFQSASLYVGDLHPDVTEVSLHRLWILFHALTLSLEHPLRLVQQSRTCCFYPCLS